MANKLEKIAKRFYIFYISIGFSTLISIFISMILLPIYTWTPSKFLEYSLIFSALIFWALLGIISTIVFRKNFDKNDKKLIRNLKRAAFFTIGFGIVYGLIWSIIGFGFPYGDLGILNDNMSLYILIIYIVAVDVGYGIYILHSLKRLNDSSFPRMTNFKEEITKI